MNLDKIENLKILIRKSGTVVLCFLGNILLVVYVSNTCHLISDNINSLCSENLQ